MSSSPTGDGTARLPESRQLRPRQAACSRRNRQRPAQDLAHPAQTPLLSVARRPARQNHPRPSSPRDRRMKTSTDPGTRLSKLISHRCVLRSRRLETSRAASAEQGSARRRASGAVARAEPGCASSTPTGPRPQCAGTGHAASPHWHRHQPGARHRDRVLPNRNDHAPDGRSRSIYGDWDHAVAADLLIRRAQHVDSPGSGNTARPRHPLLARLLLALAGALCHTPLSATGFTGSASSARRSPRAARRQATELLDRGGFTDRAGFLPQPCPGTSVIVR